MNYKDFIDGIINTRGRHGCGNEYHEKHHIIPKCLGGENTEENYIDLFAKEHYEAHKLLALENPHNNKLQFAWWCMSSMKNHNEQERYKCTPEEYEEAKVAKSRAMSVVMTGENHPNWGKHLSQETREKLSKANSGENNPMYGVHRHGVEAPMYNVHHSDNTKRKMSEIATKRFENIENHPFYGKTGKLHYASVPIYQFGKEGNFIKEWEAISVASRETGIDKGGITRCVNHKYKECGGYHWVRKNECPSIEEYVVPCFGVKQGAESHVAKSVIQMDKEGNFIKRWGCMSDVEKELGIKVCNISQCCKHPDKAKSAGGFKWKYE